MQIKYCASPLVKIVWSGSCKVPINVCRKWNKINTPYLNSSFGWLKKKKKNFNALVQRTHIPWSSRGIELCPSLMKTRSAAMEKDVVGPHFTSRLSKLIKGDHGCWCSTSTTWCRQNKICNFDSSRSQTFMKSLFEENSPWQDPTRCQLLLSNTSAIEIDMK